jgi:hypothetical protein
VEGAGGAQEAEGAGGRGRAEGADGAQASDGTTVFFFREGGGRTRGKRRTSGGACRAVPNRMTTITFRFF